MKNTPDYYEREEELERKKSLLIKEVELSSRLIITQQSHLSSVIVLSSRRHPIARGVAKDLRRMRRCRDHDIARLNSVEYQLANLRCEEPLPF